VNIIPISLMVYGITNVYKPTNITGGHHNRYRFSWGNINTNQGFSIAMVDFQRLPEGSISGS